MWKGYDGDDGGREEKNLERKGTLRRVYMGEKNWWDVCTAVDGVILFRN